jgi:nitroreductase
MEAYLAVVAKPEVRKYEERPIPDDVLNQILQAGRAAGSSKNSQPWRFVVLRDAARRQELSAAIMAPQNLAGCAAAIVVVLLNDRLRFDAGRAAQNMMVVAWAFGVGSCPNSVRPDALDRTRQALAIPADSGIATVITLGYPAAGQPQPNRRASPDKILARVNRLPLEDLVRHERYR